jgi:hypothetical protein
MNVILLPKLPSVDLKNILSIIIAYHRALLLIKEITTQEMKQNIEPMLLELNDFLMFSTILK